MRIKRIVAFIIDYYIILFFSSVIVFFIALIGMLFDYNILNDLNLLINKIALPIVFICLFFKDLIFKNKSIGKNIMMITIKSTNDFEPRNYQLILRNIFYLIWPIEVIVLIIFNKRIGDMIFKTIVVKNNIN